MGRRRPKLLVVGIDGARADTIAAVARRPGSAHGALVRTGCWSFRARTVAITQSGPAWASALTGTGIEKHGVRDNTFSAHSLGTHPHFFARLRGNRDAVRTASIVNWAPINEHLVRPGDADVAEEYATDERVSGRAAWLLGADSDLDALFVHLDGVDCMGHRTGYAPWNPFYRRAAIRADAMLGVLLDAIAGRRHRDEEDWLVVSLSDHGGRWFGHGGRHPTTETVHFVAAGGGITPGALAGSPSVMDLAPTALRHLGVRLDETWGLDGVAR